MCDPPTGDKVLAALSRIKVDKAAGSNGLLPDIVECCGGPLLDIIVSIRVESGSHLLIHLTH